MFLRLRITGRLPALRLSPTGGHRLRLFAGESSGNSMSNSDYLMVRNRRIPSLDELTQREESVFQDHLADEDAVAERLASCLRKLKLIASTVSVTQRPMRLSIELSKS